MYIGAWTEYRLAQQRLRDEHDAPNDDGIAAQAACVLGTAPARKNCGIYHPSLSISGGSEVGALPDRESFRKTLESALSSNLAADDVEHISRALEPLMQRLPVIHSGPRKQRRVVGRRGHAKAPRCPLRERGQSHESVLSIRSEGGTRSSTYDGEGSAKSGLSAASAPTAIRVSLELRGTAGREWRRSCAQPKIPSRPGGKGDTSVPQLPLLTYPTRTNVKSDSAWARRKRRARVESWSGITPRDDMQSVSSRNSACCNGTDSQQHDYRGMRAAACDTPVREHDQDISAAAAAENDGYDGRKATTMLRLARRRDPTCLKPDFESLWLWRRKGGTGHSSTGCRQQRREVHADAAREAAAGGGGRFARERDAAAGGSAATRDRASARVEALKRMKDVYMAKGEGKGSPRAGGVGSGGDDRLGSPGQSVESRDLRGKRARTAGRTNDASVPEKGLNGAGGGSAASGGGQESAQGAVHGRSEFKDERAVVVPDLELTHSHIRQIEKYFGGGCGDGGQRQNDRLQRRSLAPSEKGTTENPPAELIRSSDARDIIRGRTSQEPQQRQQQQQQEEESSVIPPTRLDRELVREAAVSRSTSFAEFGGGKANGLASEAQLSSPSPAEAPKSSHPRPSCSDPTAVAGCGHEGKKSSPSLEDLISWTNSLDFEAAIEGF